jgi:hypothetical protein
MRIARIGVGVALGLALTITSVVRYPGLVSHWNAAPENHAYVYSTVGFTLLLAALSLWLIKSGLQKPVPAGARGPDKG